MRAIVGLGNPGRAYAHTRHNVGFDVLDLFAKRRNVRILGRQYRSLVGSLDVLGEQILLVKPQTFMNESGSAVGQIARKHNLEPGDLLVIYDDMDLPLGKVRIRMRGSSGGHKGMKSIIAHLHSEDFPRIRIGIGRRGEAIDHVLSRFNRAERKIMDETIASAADALDMILSDGIEAAMNEYNRTSEEQDPDMNDRERYIETLLFGKSDRIPFVPGGPRESTLKAWHEQGLPEGVNWDRYLREQIGIEPAPTGPRPGVGFHHQMIPEFEQKVIEERENSLVVQDWKGNICEISKRFDVTYLRSAKDFVTRKWIKCPVENWADWQDMKRRYDPDDPARVAENVPELGKQIENRDYPVAIGVSGPFWQLREWLGFEGLCMMFLDDPDLVRDMIGFWTNYISKLLLKVTPYVRIDHFLISEDMAYKVKAMISPEMTRDFLGPCYGQWNDIIKSNGCPIYHCDSDGFVGELIPVWIDFGINVTSPLEVAAGNDINELRRTFGKKIAFTGGVDKRAMAKGGGVIREEMARVEPVVKDGGYIPGCDHGVPPDVSWPDFVDYCDILARMTGWK